MRASFRLLLIVFATCASVGVTYQVAAAAGRDDSALGRLLAPAPGIQASGIEVAQRGCRIPDRCVDGRGQWICPCTPDAKACGFCGQSY